MFSKDLHVPQKEDALRLVHEPGLSERNPTNMSGLAGWKAVHACDR